MQSPQVYGKIHSDEIHGQVGFRQADTMSGTMYSWSWSWSATLGCRVTQTD